MSLKLSLRRAALVVMAASLPAFAAVADAVAADFEPGEDLPGGDTTTSDQGRNAFSYPAANLSVDRQTPFFIGNSFFRKNWVEAPASTTGRDGLGPHFIARACAGCHILDGRGAPPPAPDGVNTEQPVGLLFRLSIPATPAQPAG